MIRVSFDLEAGMAREFMHSLDQLVAIDAYRNGGMDEVMLGGKIFDEHDDPYDDDISVEFDVQFETISGILQTLHSSGAIHFEAI